MNKINIPYEQQLRNKWKPILEGCNVPEEEKFEVAKDLEARERGTKYNHRMAVMQRYVLEIKQKYSSRAEKGE